MAEVKTAAEIAAERVKHDAPSSGGVSIEDYRLFKEDTIRHIKELRTALKTLQKSIDKKQQQ